MLSDSVAYQKAKQFAKRVVLLGKHLRDEHQEYILSKQIVRSGTSIGANIAEARCGCSRKDFINKIYIALKECAETLYWIDLLHDTDYLTDEEFESMNADCEELRKILSATTKAVQL